MGAGTAQARVGPSQGPTVPDGAAVEYPARSWRSDGMAWVCPNGRGPEHGGHRLGGASWPPRSPRSCWFPTPWPPTSGTSSTRPADALAAADVAVAVARARLTAATGELEAARRRRADALVALEAASDEVGRQEARLAWQVRRAYMTGGVSGLAVVVQASDLRDLMERAVTLSYVIRADQDVLGRLERARRRSVRLHAAMVTAEQAQAAAEARVRGQVGELERVRAVRQQAKQRMDARVARLAGAAAALRSRSAELRRLIRQEELARRRAARGGERAAGRGGVVTCRAPRRPST